MSEGVGVESEGLQTIEDLAQGPRACADGLWGDERISKGRAVWSHDPNPPRGGLNPGQHRRRMWPGRQCRAWAFPANRHGLDLGIGVSLVARQRLGIPYGREGRTASCDGA